MLLWIIFWFSACLCDCVDGVQILLVGGVLVCFGLIYKVVADFTNIVDDFLVGLFFYGAGVFIFAGTCLSALS